MNFLKLTRRGFCSSSVGTNLKFLESSKTCSIVQYKNRPIYIVGDNGSDSSFDRIKSSVSGLKPCSMLVEDEDIFSTKSYKRRYAHGKVVKESYMALYSKYYPNMGNTMEMYQEAQANTIGAKVMNLDSISDTVKENIVWAGTDVASSILGQLLYGDIEDFVHDFTEDTLREALKRRRKMTSDPKDRPKDKPPISFTGPLNEEDEQELIEQQQMEQEMFEDLKHLSTKFDSVDKLLTLVDYKKVEQIVHGKDGNNNNIELYDKLNDKAVVRRFGLNEIIHKGLKKSQFVKIGTKVFDTLRVFYAGRDRTLIREMIQECMRLDANEIEGCMVAIVHFTNIYGIDSLWKDAQFWEGEHIAMENIKAEENVDKLRANLRQMGLPFMEGAADKNLDKDGELGFRPTP